MQTTQSNAHGPSDSPAAQASLCSLMADETRIRILRELYAVSVDETGREGLSFATLRRRSGVSDSGRFNYHLSQLTDELVRKHDDTYVLTPIGQRLVRALERPPTHVQ